MRALSMPVVIAAAGSLSMLAGCSRKPETLAVEYDEVETEAAMKNVPHGAAAAIEHILDELERAYVARDLDAIVRCKSFRLEAQEIIANRKQARGMTDMWRTS